jgi:hypothetical protein
MIISKETLGLAAEFAVAAELCKRSIYAQLTLGHRKRTDILVETEKGMLRIQVKGKQGKEWPGCKGIRGEGIVLAFVDFENKKETERPDFYILTVADWENLIERELISTGKVSRGEVRINENKMPIWKDGYEGMGIKPSGIMEYKERWDKIEDIVGERNTSQSQQTLYVVPTKEVSMKQFIDDDAGYLQWVNTNHNGFVVNCYRQPSPRYLMLHRATCRTIAGHPARGESWTVDYIKICSLNRVELEAWTKDKIGGKLRYCQICKP